MAFGLIRARNLSAADIISTDIHNARRYETQEQYPENVPLEKRNDFFIDALYLLENHEDYLGKEETTLAEAIEERLKIHEVKGIKSKGQGKLSEIGEGFRAQTSFNFANSCLNRYNAGKTKYWDSTKTYLWKIQKK